MEAVRESDGARLRRADDYESSLFLSVFGDSEDFRRDRSGTTSLLATLLDVLRNSDALCPSFERLEQYRQDAAAEEFRDVHYHYETKGCPFCREKGNESRD